MLRKFLLEIDALHLVPEFIIITILLLTEQLALTSV